MKKLRTFHGCAAVCLVALIFICLGWELRWAPLRPGGSLLVLKALPLLLPLFGILRGNRYTFQWASMFMLIYLIEGLVRASSEDGASRLLASAEILLALGFLTSTICYLRLARRLSGNCPSPTTAD